MSELLDALIEQRREGMLEYKQYLEKIASLTKDAAKPGGGRSDYPPAMNTAGKRALYNNLGKDGKLAMTIDAAVQVRAQDGWRSNAMKTRRVRAAIRNVLTAYAGRLQSPEGNTAAGTAATYTVTPPDVEAETDRILELVRHQSDY